MPWIIILAFALHPEKKAIGFGLCSCEGKDGTRNILRFPFALVTNVLRFPLCLTTPCYKGPLPVSPSPWPCFGHWPMMRAQDHGFQPSLCSSLPKAFLLHTSRGEPWVYSHTRLLHPCPGRCCCRSGAGSRKWQLIVPETHVQLLWEQELDNLMLLPCQPEPCRGW